MGEEMNRSKNPGARRSTISRAAIAVTGSAAAVLAFAAPVSAEDLITLEVDNVAYGSEGDLLPVGSITMPAEFVGETCLVRGASVNQESVHPDNDLIIVAGEQTLVVPDIEGLADQVTEADEFEEISETIEVFIRLGPDGVTSGGFVVTVDCSMIPEPTTTTTAPATTTTAPPETTTTTGAIDPQGGGSIVDPTTTTAPPPAGPTTLQPETTVAPTTTPPPAGPTLPVTGSSVGIFVFSGLWLIAAGVWLQQRAVFARPTR